MSMKSAVDRLQEKSGKYFRVVRSDVHTKFGTALKMGVESKIVPTFILYSGDKDEVMRFHSVPDLERIKSLLAELNKS